MASVFTHTFVAYTFSKLMKEKYQNLGILLWGVFCSVIPDADVVMFKLGYAYEHPLGHRGFFHSFFFCIMLALAITLTYKVFTSVSYKKTIVIFIFLALCGCSHGLLDAMTTGGKGIAFFAPFDNSRYFLPFRPIKVSPIGIENFFSDWGLKVILSEIRWVIIPCSFLLVFNFIVKKISK